MSVGQITPSPFATLLRRSKFASYDPSIGQVYTTYGGHAFRGNWGLKRPLPNRRRTGFITVRSIDSPEKQTEWNSAESSARWIRRWEELGKKLEVEELGPWGSKSNHLSWTLDTEFDRAGKVGLGLSRERLREQGVMDARNIIPNPDIMTPKQFRKYLHLLRALRPEFKVFLKDQWDNVEEKARMRSIPRLRSEQTTLSISGTGEVDMYTSAQGPTESHVIEFLKRRAKVDISSPDSRRIEQRPHTFAGLEYTYMSALQSQYLHKPAPGRDIAQSRASQWSKGRVERKYDLAAVGGIVGELPQGSHNLLPTDFGTRELPRRDREQGKGLFRLSKVWLQSAPVTVGRVPQGASRAELRSIEFRTTEAANANRSNPHPLGSAEYVREAGIAQGKGRTLLVPRSVVKMVQNTHRPVRRQDQAASGGLLDTLSYMIQAKT